MKSLAVFAKWPEPGRVKTRLVPALPATLACELHRALLADTLSVAARARADRRFLYWDGAPEDAAVAATPAPFEPRRQHGPDLGARLACAFDEMLAPGGVAVAIGADCPALDAATLDLALEALVDHDLALGPSHDGGYYLIGLARPAAPLFHGVSWGSARVYRETVERAGSLGLALQALPERADLDTPGDLVRWMRAGLARTEDLGPAAIAALRAMRLMP